MRGGVKSRNKLVLAVLSLALILTISFVLTLPLGIWGCQRQKQVPQKKALVELHRFGKSSIVKLGKPVTILLLGSDTRTRSISDSRSDAIMIVKINPKTHRAAIVSFPRDSWVSIPGRGNRKINSALAEGGPELMAKTIENYSGLSIDYYAVSTFGGFRRIIDQFGGVKITLKESIKDRWAKANLSAGTQTLNGAQALAFSRSRHIPGGDFARAGHQQDILLALFEQEAAQPSLVRMVGGVAAIANNCTTDLAPREMLQLAQAVYSLKASSIYRVVLPGSTGSAGGASVVFLDKSRANQIFDKVKSI